METNATWLFCSSSGLLQGTPLAADIGRCWVNVSVTDGNDLDFTNFTLEVFSSNKAPVITTTDVTSCLEDQLYSVDYDAVDDDALSWSLVTNATFLDIDSHTGLLSGIPGNPDVGKYGVQIFVTDGTLNDSVVFNLTVLNVNDPPQIGEDPSNVPVYDQTLRKYVKKKIGLYCLEDSPAYLNFSAYDEDPTYDTLSWTIISGPKFLQTTSSQGRHLTGVLGNMNITGTPANRDVGKHRVTIRVDDGTLYVETAFNLTVNNTNDPPSITTMDLTDGYRNSNYYVDYDASDIDPTNDTLNWALSTNAQFLSINPALGIVSGTPSSSQTGLYWVNVTVSDGNGGSDFSNFTLTVHHNNTAPSSTGGVPLLRFDEDSEDDSIDIDSLFSDTDGDDLSYSVEYGENLTATITEDNRLVIIPKQNWAGTDHVRIFAFDGEYTTSILLTVVIDNINDQPSIIGIMFVSELREGIPMVFMGIVDDPDLPYGDVLTYEWFIEDIGLVGTGHDLKIDLDAGHYVMKLVVTDSHGIKVEKEVTFDVRGDPENDAWWVPLLILIIVLMIMMMAAVGIFFLQRRRREVPETSEIMKTSNTSNSSSKGFPSDGPTLQAAPMLENDDGYCLPVMGGGLDAKGAPEVKDSISIMGDASLLDSIEMDGDPLIKSAYDDILSREEARDKSHIQELREALRKRIIEEEEDEEVFDELNEILEEVEE
ncbi:MAG: putative Ig domain-containing protein [Thermoplasmatota archaeon]